MFGDPSIDSVVYDDELTIKDYANKMFLGFTDDPKEFQIKWNNAHYGDRFTENLQEMDITKYLKGGKMDSKIQFELAREISHKILVNNNPQCELYQYNEYGDQCGYLVDIQLQYNEIYSVVLDAIRSHYRWDYRKL